MGRTGFLPRQHGLYDSAFERDSCGVGFVADIRGRRSHQTLCDASEMLVSMAHRGAAGSEPNSGDGAGILTALPHAFLVKVANRDLGTSLPPEGTVASGLVFLPRDKSRRDDYKSRVESIIRDQGQSVVGWRQVPTDAERADLGPSARANEPAVEQLFVAAEPGLAKESFERQLYVIRKRATTLLAVAEPGQEDLFHVCSLSSRVLVYKGQFLARQLFQYYPDLSDPDFKSPLAMVHSRFSTNTFPSWDRAQPNRLMSHNGEINTLRGNTNWMRARQGTLQSPIFGSDLPKVFPILEPGRSDSGHFDNVLEFLVLSGRSLPEAIMMMIPEAWQNDPSMSPQKKAFYEFHSCMMEPWDGPASIVFTDGRYLGAVLDRNGLRPSRYYVTFDDRVILASEVGVIPTDPANIMTKGRLQPGRMFLVDLQEGRIVSDSEIKHDLSARRPYRKWLQRHTIELDDLSPGEPVARLDSGELKRRLCAFGYTVETFKFMLLPLVGEKRDPLGSMGNDSSLACLSDQPRLLYDYFKQLFAQVTNPPIDSIREEVIMALECRIGPEGDLLETQPSQAKRLRLRHPILSNEELARIRKMDHRGWRSRTLDMTWPREEGAAGMTRALLRLCREAQEAVKEGYSLLILSDRATSCDRVPLSSLLACGAVHHHLVDRSSRTRVGIILESGEAREVHHHCLLIGYGADAINPYLSFEALWEARREGLLAAGFGEEAIVSAYRQGVGKGILKVMAKMGISTLQSYKGAQIFEALGLAAEVIERCFKGTPSRIAGAGFDVLAAESLCRHELGYSRATPALCNPGEFQWRAGGEKHAWGPSVIAELQKAARGRSRQAYRRFARLVDEDSRTRCTLRGLLGFNREVNGGPIPLEDVEPARQIVRRFCTGAMSFGSISGETHQTLALAMNRIGGKSNTGEGGEDPRRFLPLPGGESQRSAIKQVASGRFGVTMWYLTNADELQIKIAQGAKPGEGGELPGHKVDKIIARVRHSTPGVGLISPPPHHDIYSIEDLKQLIFDLRNANPEARISVKLVSEVGVGTIAAGVVKARADHILISGDSGGTGASPLTSIKHAGLPWELGIAETHQTLVLNNLRSRVVLQTDGGLKTGRDVVVAALLGAEEFGFSTAPLVALGCIMMRKCHLNTCPVGIATQDPLLRKRFRGHPEHVINYLFLVAEETRQYMAELGFRTVDEMVGRSDVLFREGARKHWKAAGLDLSPILARARRPHEGVETRGTGSRNQGPDRIADRRFIEACKPALEAGEPVRVEMPVNNTDRCLGTLLSGEIARCRGESGLPDDTIHLRFSGSAGQSLGAWLGRGVTIELEGDANDYVGKGLCGGKLILYPPKVSRFRAEENIIVGNVVLYGATSGEAYFRGRAAERFCVRNSGAWAVVEGVGDHGCEYMTGGRVVVLGSVGRNFAAGMSGGIAYVLDLTGDFRQKCNLKTVRLTRVESAEETEELLAMITRHRGHTGSTVAERVLQDWNRALAGFVKVLPRDYERVLRRRESGEEDTEAA